MHHAVLASILLCALGCQPGAPSDPPEGAVQRFFSIVEAGDCAALQGATGGALGTRLRERGCTDFTADLRRHGVRLLSVVSVQPDGRDPTARIVRTRLEKEGKPHETLLRVEAREGRWVLVVL